MDWLLDFLGLNKGKATQQAADQNRQVLSSLDTRGTGYLNQALEAARGVTSRGEAGADLYMDALGINGADGRTRAMGAYDTAPGYADALAAGEDAILRRGAAMGMLGSGNTAIDLGRYTGDMQLRDWNSWLDRLAPYTDLATTGAGMEMGALGDLTNWAAGIGSGQMAANNQVAAGKEAGQGALWDLLGNVAGVAGSFAGMGGFPRGGGGVGQGRTGANTFANSTGRYGLGYGGGF